MKKYGWNLLIMLDMVVNCVFLLGSPHETISGRTGRAMASGKPKWFVPPFQKVLDFVAREGFDDDNHSKDSIEDCNEILDSEIYSWIKK